MSTAMSNLREEEYEEWTAVRGADRSSTTSAQELEPVSSGTKLKAGVDHHGGHSVGSAGVGLQLLPDVVLGGNVRKLRED